MGGGLLGRARLSLRPATAEDVLLLLELWSDVLAPGDAQEQAADIELVVKGAAASPEQRILVAELDGQPAGAVMLQVRPRSALDREPVVEAVAPHVLPAFRRQGVGLALIEAAAVFAEELGVTHVVTATTSSSREANRFMARVGLRPRAVLRLANVYALRAGVEAQRPPATRDARRGRLAAARRTRLNRRNGPSAPTRT